MAGHEALHRRERQWSEIDDVSRRRDRVVEFSPIGHDAVGQGDLVGAAAWQHGRPRTVAGLGTAMQLIDHFAGFM
jgi:hypothetical protein